MLRCTQSEAMTQPPARGTGQPEEKPAEMQPYKAHGTPDREADHKDQGPQQCDPETPLRNTGNHSPTRVETKSDTHPCVTGWGGVWVHPEQHTMSYTDQYQEHLDHIDGSATEFQNCFTEAHAKVQELSREFSAPIVRARSLGLFVVAEEIEYYCKATDALAGTYNRFVAAFPAEQSANDRVQRFYSKNLDRDSRYIVLPPL